MLDLWHGCSLFLSSCFWKSLAWSNNMLIFCLGSGYSCWVVALAQMWAKHYLPRADWQMFNCSWTPCLWDCSPSPWTGCWQASTPGKCSNSPHIFNNQCKNSGKKKCFLDFFSHLLDDCFPFQCLIGLWYTSDGGGRTDCWERAQINKNSSYFWCWNASLLQETGVWAWRAVHGEISCMTKDNHGGLWLIFVIYVMENFVFITYLYIMSLSVQKSPSQLYFLFLI